MDVETAIRTRRTHKAYAPGQVDRAELEEILDLARWAPNHHLTNPWRFRVVGPHALERLKRAAGPGGRVEARPRADAGRLLLRARRRRPVQDEEDLHATACAAYIVLLAAHARGLAGYWRTPEVLRTPEGREAVGLPDSERFVGLLHLGRGVQEQSAPERAACRAGRRVPRLGPPPVTLYIGRRDFAGRRPQQRSRASNSTSS